MPELPDLTVFADNLDAIYARKQITGVRVGVPKVIAPATESAFVRGLLGKTVRAVRRHGKQLVLPLDDDTALWLHLMLHGEIHPIQRTLPTHTCVVIEFSEAGRLAFTDRTRWMKLGIYPGGEVPPWASAGVDPLSVSFTADYLAGALKKKSRSEIKQMLMDQKTISGIGNAYADEILWAAKIAPQRKAGMITDTEREQLFSGIHDVLRRAITMVKKKIHGGFTGEVRDFLAVHGFRGKPCPRCATPVHYMEVHGRGTYMCQNCQT